MKAIFSLSFWLLLGVFLVSQVPAGPNSIYAHAAERVLAYLLYEAEGTILGAGNIQPGADCSPGQNRRCDFHQFLTYIAGKAAIDSSAQKDYYKILNVPRTVDQGVIKSAYRRLVKYYHPDRAPSLGLTLEESQRILASINEAYEVLGDPYLRAQFDMGDDPNSPKQQLSTFRPESRENIEATIKLLATDSRMERIVDSDFMPNLVLKSAGNGYVKLVSEEYPKYIKDLDQQVDAMPAGAAKNKAITLMNNGAIAKELLKTFDNNKGNALYTTKLIRDPLDPGKIIRYGTYNPPLAPIVWKEVTRSYAGKEYKVVDLATVQALPENSRTWAELGDAITEHASLVEQGKAGDDWRPESKSMVESHAPVSNAFRRLHKQKVPGTNYPARNLAVLEKKKCGK